MSLAMNAAHEYVKLGRTEKVVSILSHFDPAVRSGALPVDIVVLLRYSAALAATREVLMT